MTLNSFTSGVNTSFSTQLNQNFLGNSIKQVYTSTGFNVSLTSSTTSTTSSAYELTSTSSTAIGSANYMLLTMTLKSTSQYIKNGGSETNARPDLQVEVKEVGGAYGDLLAQTPLTFLNPNYDDAGSLTELKTIQLVHTLTAGQKANGVQFKITGHAAVGGTYSSCTAALANVQTILSTVN